MRRTPLRIVLFLLFALSALAEPHVTRMIKSEPVVSGGLEFIAATEREWVCFNPPHGEDPVQIQLFIRNVSDAPLLFQTFDTFAITIRTADGERVVNRGGRDGTLRTRPVLIEPGGRYCLARKADLSWNEDGKNRTFIYRDGTGSWASFSPISTSTYTLIFSCKQAGEAPSGAPAANWIGDISTKEIAFQVVDP